MNVHVSFVYNHAAIVHLLTVHVWLTCRSVTDPRDGKRVALKKMPNVFQNLVAAKRVYRELRMLCHFKHDNVSKNWTHENEKGRPNSQCILTILASRLIFFLCIGVTSV